MSYLDTKIQYYPASVYETVPIGVCTLKQMLEAIRSPKQEMLTLLKQIEEATRVGDKKLKAELKSKLYYLSPCVFTDGKGRKYDNISYWTGLLILDFDGLDEDISKELKQFMFEEYPFIIASFLSSSKRGVKCIARIPVCKSVEEFKSYFYGLAVKLQWIKGFDPSSQNNLLPNYITYDTDILIREDATTWTGTGYKENEFEIGAIILQTDKIEDVTEQDREEVVKVVQCIIDKAVDTGHVYLRSASLVMWGYCGAGYFTEEESQTILFDMIDDNAYLSQKPNVYKRTVMDMKRLGELAPLYLKRHER